MMKVFRKDVSDEELKAVMAPELARLMKGVRCRIRLEEAAGSEKKAQKVGGLISGDEKELIEDVFESPNLSVTARASGLGWSADKMNRIKNLNIERGMLESFKVNLGKPFGGIVKLLGLTKPGFKFLNKQPVVKPDKVSWPHWWWQTNIRDYFANKGVEVVIEMSKGGLRADIGLKLKGEVVAIEVEMSTKNAVQNIVNDLGAGFDRVVCCCKDKMTAKAVTKSLEATKSYEAIKDRVEVKVLTELQLVKELFGKR